MRFFEQGVQALRAEARLLAAALRDRRLAVAIAIFAALLLLAAQAPLRYTIAVGQADTFGSDLPLVAGFHAPEIAESTRRDFRWTTERSLIRLPGAGQRALLVGIRLLLVNQEIAERGPRAIELWAGGRLVGRLEPRHTAGEVFRVLLPPPADGSGDQQIELRSATYTPAGDQRAIGAPVDEVTVDSVSWPSLPAWRSTLAWLGAALLLWLALRRIGLAPFAAQALLIAAVLPASLAALLDPPRFAFGASAALTAAALGWLLTLLLVAAPAGLALAGLALALPGAGLRLLGGAAGAALLAVGLALVVAGWLRPLAASYRRLAPPIPAVARPRLLLIALVVLTTHYGGKIYPESMPGDIGFHTNHFTQMLQGSVLQISRNRGVDFPYPPAFYLVLAPLLLVGLNMRVALQLGGALLDALSPFVVYTIAAAGLARAAGEHPAAGRWRTGVLAAGIYALSAATMMTTWWNFSTHTFTQFAHLLLIAAIVLVWPATTDDRRPTTALLETGDWRLETGRVSPASNPQHPAPGAVVRSRWSVVVLLVLQSLVYLGHFGFWMNMSLLGALGLAALLAGEQRGQVAWPTFRLFLVGFVAAELFAALFFYSDYAGLFIAQAQAAAAGGLTGMANKPAADRAALWRTLWDAGFRTHFGFFPVPLALCGLALLWRRTTNGQQAASRKSQVANDAAPATCDLRPATETTHRTSRVTRQAVLVGLMLGTFAVALLIAAIPFVTGAALTTRWLMFSAWAIAVAAALAGRLIWRAGRAGRWAVLAMGGYVVWVTASMWLAALAWQVRPPEPF